MLNRALLVLDQVSRPALDRELAHQGLTPSTPVTLDYLPRTTPVGHATISTGAPPSVHRVQGRTWYEHGALTRHDVGQAVTLTRPNAAAPLHHLATNSLAANVRSVDAGSIVAVAAKDFIPFLFGAWDCDVVVYPFDVAPAPVASQGGAIGLSIVFVAWTASGAVALARSWAHITTTLSGMCPPGTTMHAPPPSPAAALPAVHLVTWLIPTHWGSVPASFAPAWRNYVLASADTIDDGYTTIGQTLLGHLPAPHALLQSCFATDAHGHASGPSSAAYTGSVAAGVLRAQRLAAAGFKVGVTSDHGGRDTPRVAGYDRSAATIDGVALPTSSVHYKDGDHVVGYAPGSASAFWTSASPTLTPFTVPAAMVARSYHPAQRPAWRVTGDNATRIDKVGARPGGGDHGLCASGGTVDPIDNEVPAWSPNGRSSHTPAMLDDIRAWFLGLT